MAQAVRCSGRLGVEPFLESFLFPDVASRGLPPYVASPSDGALDGGRGGYGRPHIEVENGLSVLLPARVVIDDIPDLFLLPVDVTRNEPIVTIERRLRPRSQVLVGVARRRDGVPNLLEHGGIKPPHDLEHGCFGRHVLRPTLEPHETGLYLLHLFLVPVLLNHAVEVLLALAAFL